MTGRRLPARLGYLSMLLSTHSICWLTGTPWLRLQFCKRAVQLRGFERQFELVRRSGLPAFLHSRAAAPDTLAALRRHAADMPAGGVVHSFDGAADEAASLIELPNIYLGAK